MSILSLLPLTGCHHGNPSPAPPAALPQCLKSQITSTPLTLSIKNLTATSWTKVDVQLNRGDNNSPFVAAIDSIPAGDVGTLQLSEFVRPDGFRFNPETYVVVDVRFTSDQGAYTQLGCDVKFTQHYYELLREP